MAYRIKLDISQNSSGIEGMSAKVDRLVAPILRDSLNLLQQYAVQNLSGVPFQSETGTHTIQKRSGKGAASVQVQSPYGSPFRGRVFASALTQYPGNPEQYNYLGILEHGRGEIKPKYTSSMQGDTPGKARLSLPGGSSQLVSGMSGFRGVTGSYRFVKRIPPMVGKYWFKNAIERAKPEFANIATQYWEELLNE